VLFDRWAWRRGEPRLFVLDSHRLLQVSLDAASLPSPASIPLSRSLSVLPPASPAAHSPSSSDLPPLSGPGGSKKLAITRTQSVVSATTQLAPRKVRALSVTVLAGATTEGFVDGDGRVLRKNSLVTAGSASASPASSGNSNAGGFVSAARFSLPQALCQARGQTEDNNSTDNK
jgi:hypothetical protein